MRRRPSRGSEFLNHDVITWAADAGIHFTRSRPYKKNDQGTVESKNHHLVRRFGFHYRYGTPSPPGPPDDDNRCRRAPSCRV